jgi:hypothetical protein
MYDPFDPVLMMFTLSPTKLRGLLLDGIAGEPTSNMLDC